EIGSRTDAAPGVPIEQVPDCGPQRKEMDWKIQTLDPGIAWESRALAEATPSAPDTDQGWFVAGGARRVLNWRFGRGSQERSQTVRAKHPVLECRAVFF